MCLKVAVLQLLQDVADSHEQAANTMIQMVRASTGADKLQCASRTIHRILVLQVVFLHIALSISCLGDLLLTRVFLPTKTLGLHRLSRGILE